MNPIFPNFNFDQWLEEFHITSIFWKEESPDPREVEIEKEDLALIRTMFYAQVHLESDDVGCGGCEYLEILGRFNKFMSVVSDSMTVFQEVVELFIHSDYKSSIAQSLCQGCTVVTDSGKYQSYMADNIQALLTRLEIHVDR